MIQNRTYQSLLLHGDAALYLLESSHIIGREDMANDFNKALRSDGHFATMLIFRDSLRHPVARIPELIRLQQRCTRAARTLGDFIADCRF